ncbi:MAG: hypothetical protein K5989_06030 [Lachnospiraceae bacterium]|nr:hypothetical protein [Lachnospiraceae bacterium]
MGDGQDENSTPVEGVSGEGEIAEITAVKEKEQEPEEVHLKTRTIPAVIMLMGGLATAIMCFIWNYPPERSLITLLCSLILFLIIGGIAKALLDKIVIKVEKPESRDAVIERTSAGDEGEVGQDGTESVKS